MVKSPPTPSEENAKDSWRVFVGGPQKNAVATSSSSSSQASATEDKPPENSKEDSVKQQTAADMEANRGLREKYADRAYYLAFVCLLMWVLLLAISGGINAYQGREMWSDKVIIAVTTGVTVNVLAAFLGVIRGLFPNHALPKK